MNEESLRPNPANQLRMRLPQAAAPRLRLVKCDEFTTSTGDAHDSCRKGRAWRVRTSFSRIPEAVAPVVSAVRRPAVAMVKLSKEAKQRLQQLFKGGQFAIRWGFIPFVIYLGFKRGADPGMPEPTVLSLLWG
uniref:Mitochondrial import receptor subunit TOM7 homolog n=2 Tax=Leporidae TaxID=9979 RepID=A0A5F9D449_RABIT